MMQDKKVDLTSTQRWKLFRICSQKGMFKFMAERVKDTKYAPVEVREALAEKLIAEIEEMESATSRLGETPV